MLEEHRTEFPSLIIQSTPKRYYPDGPAVASIIGYTGEISETELTKDVASIRHPIFREALCDTSANA